MITHPITCFGILGLSIASLWIVAGQPVVWQALLVLATGLALVSGVITATGLAFGLTAGCSIYGYFRVPCSRLMKALSGALAAILTLGLFAHMFPGFNDVTLLSNTVLVPGAYPTSIVWSFDKPLAGLLLAAWGTDRTLQIKDLKQLLPVALSLYVVCAVLMSLGAILLHVLAWAPHWTSLTAKFAFANLLFVCVPEEVLFRGLLQRGLEKHFASSKWGKTASLAAASILFGVCHFAGGLGLMLSATVAGFFYGAAYQRTGRIEASIVVHFLLNLSHFTLFTYPALRQ